MLALRCRAPCLLQQIKASGSAPAVFSPLSPLPCRLLPLPARLVELWKRVWLEAKRWECFRLEGGSGQSHGIIAFGTAQSPGFPTCVLGHFSLQAPVTPPCSSSHPSLDFLLFLFSFTSCNKPAKSQAMGNPQPSEMEASDHESLVFPPPESCGGNQPPQV